MLRYAKDLGLNMLRLEGKFSSEHLVEQADEMGIPLMFGWMCCNQWEKWDQWDAEDNRVATDSLRSQILMLHNHASAFVWANGSDGLPPPPVLATNTTRSSKICTGRTPSSTPCRLSPGTPTAIAMWDGIDMAGPVQLATADVLVQRPLRRHLRAPRPNRATTNTFRRSRA